MNGLEFDHDLHVLTKTMQGQSIDTTCAHVTCCRLADVLVVMDSRLVIRVENMVTTSSLEVLEVDLNGTTSSSLWRTLLISFTSFTSPCLTMST